MCDAKTLAPHTPPPLCTAPASTVAMTTSQP